MSFLKRLGIRVEIPKATVDDGSYRVDQDGRFISGNFAFDAEGLKSAEEDFVTDDETGFKLADMEIGRLLGSGNSGDVYLTQHKPSGTMLVLKVINIMTRDNRHQLLKEVRSLYRADSPYLVSFYGAFYQDPAIFVALEYMDAGSLADVLSTSAVRASEAVLAAIARQIVEGLGYLQQRRQVHRDIKPSNICLSTSGAVKLTDFGISKELEDSIAACDTFTGTFMYMSPERVQGQAHSYNSDIWSLGMLLVEAATGSYPYPFNGVYFALLQRIAEGPPPFPEDISPEFESFLALCLDPDAAKRPTADALLDHEFIRDFAEPQRCYTPVAEWLAAGLKATEECTDAGDGDLLTVSDSGEQHLHTPKTTPKRTVARTIPRKT